MKKFLITENAALNIQLTLKHYADTIELEGGDAYMINFWIQELSNILEGASYDSSEN